MGLIYKTLFEVKLLHEFYLTEPKGEGIFDFDLPEDRLAFLRERFELNRVTVNNNLTYHIPDAIQEILKGNRIRLTPSYSGFKIMIEVNEKILVDGTRAYMPKIKLPENFAIITGLVKKNNGAEAFSNARLARRVPSIYYFTNDSINSLKQFPSLASSIAAVDPLSVYQLGELASFGTNDIRQFTGLTSDPWQPIRNIGYVNENDRLLVPIKFRYRFAAVDKVKEAVFVLKNKNGDIIKVIESKDHNPLDQVFLDFTHPDLFSFPLETSHEKNLYELEVTGDNGFNLKHQLLFADTDLNTGNYWGFVHILSRVPNNAFNIIDNDGLLITRRTIDGDVISFPIFELGIKSKLTYWRYFHNKKKKLKLTATTTDFLDNNGGKLVTKQPRRSSFLATLFKNEINNTYHFLPNPEPGDLIQIENSRFISEIRVPESEMFPLDST